MTPESLALSRTAVDLCALAYREWEDILRTLQGIEGAGVPVPLDDPATDTEGFIVTLDGLQWVVLRGSDSLIDWKSNLQLTMVDGMHRGFRHAALGVLDQIRPALDPNLPVVLTGHSRGAGIAQAIATAPWLPPALHLITFGSPRVMDRRWAAWERKRLETFLRWVNHRDLVPWVPLARRGYRHFGELCYLTASGKLTHSRLWHAIERVLGMLHTLVSGQAEGMADHAVDAYQRAITAAEWKT